MHVAIQFIISTVIQKPLCRLGFDGNGKGLESPSPLPRYGAGEDATREGSPRFLATGYSNTCIFLPQHSGPVPPDGVAVKVLHWGQI